MDCPALDGEGKVNYNGEGRTGYGAVGILHSSCRADGSMGAGCIHAAYSVLASGAVSKMHCIQVSMPYASDKNAKDDAKTRDDRSHAVRETLKQVVHARAEYRVRHEIRFIVIVFT